jgi:hypothetical protein
LSTEIVDHGETAVLVDEGVLLPLHRRTFVTCSETLALTT